MFGICSRRGTHIRQIREGIDSYPGGLCFAAPEGTPILVNRQMNELVYQLTGSAVMNAERTWAELKGRERDEEIKKLSQEMRTFQKERPDGAEELFFRLFDGRIWRFRKTLIRDEEGMEALQYEADDISRWYALARQLAAENEQVKKLHRRQREFLKNIVQINLDKELLSTKIRIHDEFGDCLIATQQALDHGMIRKEREKLLDAWEKAVVDMEHAPAAREGGNISHREELMHVAGMIGCRVEFSGPEPEGRQEKLALYAAIREALTNAVRHAHADCLKVVVTPEQSGYHVEISSNGEGGRQKIKEGNGLRNLRNRLESEGIRMEIRSKDGVALLLDMPKGKEA